MYFSDLNRDSALSSERNWQTELTFTRFPNYMGIVTATFVCQRGVKKKQSKPVS